MAIWDDAMSAVPETVNGIRVSGDSGTKSIKCPGCASNLRFEPTLNRLACRTCGSLYTPDSIEYTNHFGKLDYRNATVEDDDKTESCATIVAQQINLISTDGDPSIDIASNNGKDTDNTDGILIYFASDASNYCTGQTIYVDGGKTSILQRTKVLYFYLEEVVVIQDW